MGIRKRGNRWLVTAESGRDEFGVHRRVCRTVDSEDQASWLEDTHEHRAQSRASSGRYSWGPLSWPPDISPPSWLLVEVAA